MQSTAPILEIYERLQFWRRRQCALWPGLFTATLAQLPTALPPRVTTISILLNRDRTTLILLNDKRVFICDACRSLQPLHNSTVSSDSTLPPTLPPPPPTGEIAPALSPQSAPKSLLLTSSSLASSLDCPPGIPQAIPKKTPPRPQSTIAIGTAPALGSVHTQVPAPTQPQAVTAATSASVLVPGPALGAKPSQAPVNLSPSARAPIRAPAPKFAASSAASLAPARTPLPTPIPAIKSTTAPPVPASAPASTLPPVPPGEMTQNEAFVLDTGDCFRCEACAFVTPLGIVRRLLRLHECGPVLPVSLAFTVLVEAVGAARAIKGVPEEHRSWFLDSKCRKAGLDGLFFALGLLDELRLEAEQLPTAEMTVFRERARDMVRTYGMESDLFINGGESTSTRRPFLFLRRNWFPMFVGGKG